MDLIDLYQESNQQAKDIIAELPKVRPSECGLDSRCGMFWIDTDNRLVIIRTNAAQNIKYFGGFEYVDESAIWYIGEYTIFDGSEDDRVDNAVEAYEDNQTGD